MTRPSFHGLSGRERFSGVVAQLLCARGITDADAAQRFLDPKLTGLRDPEATAGPFGGRRPHSRRPARAA